MRAASGNNRLMSQMFFYGIHNDTLVEDSQAFNLLASRFMHPDFIDHCIYSTQPEALPEDFSPLHFHSCACQAFLRFLHLIKRTKRATLPDSMQIR